MRKFSFFGQKLSRKAGQICCEYGQNGIPLSQDYVHNFLQTASDQIKFWRPNPDFTLLSHSWYYTNYVQAAAFALQIAKLDSVNTLKQQPNIHIFKKELLRVELTTPKLKGLSYADLALAVQICLIPSEKFSLVPIMQEKDFRKELRMRKLKKESFEKDNIQFVY